MSCPTRQKLIALEGFITFFSFSLHSPASVFLAALYADKLGYFDQLLLTLVIFQNMAYILSPKQLHVVRLNCVEFKSSMLDLPNFLLCQFLNVSIVVLFFLFNFLLHLSTSLSTVFFLLQGLKKEMCKFFLLKIFFSILKKFHIEYRFIENNRKRGKFL